MLCSAVELGLGEESDGIISLPADAPVGAALADYLLLPDAVIDLDLTPNRGDCFSVLGIARDIAALTGAELKNANVDGVPASIADQHAVELLEPAGCPVFAGRVIRGIDPDARSPLWMVERLRRSGLREIHPVVDITNYVMLELGQPLHSYDLGLVKGSIKPRFGKNCEKLTLLDGKDVEIEEGTLVISDDSGVIGLAGIMGGLSTSVSDKTIDVFFEAAFWPPDFMAGQARRYGLHTDASMRFERGVDPTGQGRAIERATELLLEISGGTAGPLVVTEARDHIPKLKTIRLRRDRITRLLGAEIADEIVSDILVRLGLAVANKDDGWDIIPPLHRFDIAIEADLIEEVARIHGYDSIPETTGVAETPLATATELSINLETVATTLVARDYQEVVTYSFIDAEADQRISGKESLLQLSNPISSEMSVMRASLWPGMLEAAARNAARQQERIRLFEIGKSFHGTLDKHDERVRVAGLASGAVFAEQWGSKAQPVDFFDIKSDVAALLDLANGDHEVTFESLVHPALQPGQSANMLRNGETIGVIGKLHPQVAKHFALKRNVFVFELDAQKALVSQATEAELVSKFPTIRRDISFFVDEKISSAELIKAVASAAPELIRSVRIFDVYKGQGVEVGLKSVAIGLILQETSRTLTDDDADAAQAAAVLKLQQEFAAELRD
jgi:phenylalanyl-tRNA synthetase beta chain